MYVNPSSDFLINYQQVSKFLACVFLIFSLLRRAFMSSRQTLNKEKALTTFSTSLTRFMISVRSPWASSSGVGGSGRFGGPPLCVLEPVAGLSLARRLPGLLTRNRDLVRLLTGFFAFISRKPEASRVDEMKEDFERRE
jgi:hypothetical protein